jgi:hypothetical protein
MQAVKKRPFALKTGAFRYRFVTGNGERRDPGGEP